MEITCGFTIPITLYGLPPSLDQIDDIMGKIKEAGFSSMEMEIEAGNQEYIEGWQRVIDRSKELDLKVASIMAVTYDMFSLDSKKRKKSLEHFGQICDMTKRIGSGMITNCFYLPPELHPGEKTELYHGGPPVRIALPEDFHWPDVRKYVVEQLNESSRIASDNGLDFAMEIRAGDFMTSVDGLISLFDESEADNIGVIYDVAHVHAVKEYLDLGIHKFSENNYVKLVHLSDNDGTHAYHNPPGQGNIDFENVIHTLKKIGYDGYLVVDINEVDNIMSEAVKMKDMLEELI